MKEKPPDAVPPPGPSPLYPAAWGWNSGGRAGNVTEDEIRSPKRLQKSILKDESFIGCAAGEHHTLLVSDEGRVYALGEGRRGQLGFGNQFTGPLKKGGVYQATPKMVTPSGVQKYKHDMKISQVACGGSFSVARELSMEEGIDIVIGYRELEKAMVLLKARYGESSSILNVWSLVRQERFRISRQAEGQVLVWGTGEHGELGLGVLGKLSIYPQPVWKFHDVCITHVAAGARHVLAIDSRGRLFSWGCGKSGRLGHGDFLDRDRPEIVMFFVSLFAESCAAGDAHSAVLTTMRAGSRETQLKRISTFGRGAHGRLGNGTNRNMCNPVLVSQWLPSLQNVQFHQVACGGAHTLALASQVVPQGIANPRGRETFVAAWGYGKNGQLGTGYRFDSLVPIKARMPRWDIITEISAGRSWSMAKSAGGELYTWGKGLRGQLGQGEEKFCLAPRKIESFASFVCISSGYAHNVCITTPKKHLNTALTEAKARHDGRLYDPFPSYVPATLKKTNSTSLFAFDCCRRTIASDVAPWRQKVRFRCLDCKCTSICLLCARLCHRGHRIATISATAIDTVENIEAEEPESHSSDYMPYQCAVLYLSHKAVLRPKRVSLECMPRVSILDVAVYLKQPPPPLMPGQKVEVRRRNRESNKENEVNARYLTVDRELHHIVKASKVKEADKISRKFKLTTPKVKTPNSSPIKSRPGAGNSSKSNSVAATRTTVAAATAAPEVPTKRVPCCRCGVFNANCRLIPVIPEHPDEDKLHLEEKALALLPVKKRGASNNKRRANADTEEGDDVVPTANSATSTTASERKGLIPVSAAAPPASTKQQPGKSKKSGTGTRKKAISDSARDPTALRNHYLLRQQGVRHLAARRIQRVARRYMRQCREHKAHLQYILLRREVCAEHFQKQILDVVFGVVKKEYASYREIQELAEMAQEESLTRVYTYYIKLQQSIIGIEALSYGMRRLCGMMTPTLPRVTVDGAVTDQWRPTYAHTYNSIRAQQMRLPAQRRASATLLALTTRNMPRIAEGRFREGHSTDADLVMLTERYWKDQRSEAWRNASIASAEKQEEMRRRIAALALERLKAKQNATKLVMQQAEALTLKNNQKAQGGPPPPPAGPPPRFMVLRAAYEAKQERLRKHRLVVKYQEKLEDAEFSITQKGLETKWRQRRYTIADPCDLYQRIATLRPKLQQSNLIKRRNSLPAKMHLMHMPSQAAPTDRIEQIGLSLEFFTQRCNMVQKVQQRTVKSRVDGAYLESSKRRPNDHYVHWANRLFQKSVLNPRLPYEMTSILVDGYRRRSIGEPERLARQLKVMMDTRESYCEFVESSQENFQYSRRRRSFDHGEWRDTTQGVADALGFDFEEVKKVSATVTGLKKDSLVMEQLMVKAKFMEASALTASALKEQEAPLSVNMANRFAKPTAGGGGGGGGVGKKAARKDKARGGLSAVRLAADKTADAQPAYDFSQFDAASPGFSYGGEEGGALQAPYYDAQYGGSEYGYGGTDGYGTEYDGSATQGATWGGDGSTVATWDDGSSVSQYGGYEGQHVWQEHYTDAGKTYYFNVATGQSSWELPGHVDTQIETQNQDDSGSWYWFNNVTGESKWM